MPIQRADIPYVSADKVLIESFLGSGGFASVYSVKSLQELPHERHDKLAMKTLHHHHDHHESTMDSPAKRNCAIRDLVMEAGILSSILPPHKNIIAIHAISNGFWENPETGFIVLEELSETLDRRIKRWKLLQKQKKKTYHAQSTKEHEQLTRLSNVGVGVARGLLHLHTNKIVFGDLKPQNIGFDSEGNVRLFDFGLAEVVPDDDEESEEDDDIRGAGTPRYMAPEVISKKSFQFSADVFSFSIVLWQVMSLKVPFKYARSSEGLKRRVARGSRPSLRPIASLDAKALLKASWAKSPSMRPRMSTVVEQVEDLQRVVTNCEGSLRLDTRYTS